MTSKSTRRSMVAERESTVEGRIEMAAARACVRAVDLLHRAMLASGLRQRDLADGLGVTEGRISQLLNGDGNVRVTTLARFLRASGYQLTLDARPVEPQRGPISRRESTRRRVSRSMHITVAEAPTATETGVGTETVWVLSENPSGSFLGPVETRRSVKGPRQSIKYTTRAVKETV